MDLNYLYHRRGRSLMMAARAACEPSRSAHLALAHGYCARIETIRRDRRAASARLTLAAA
ncbi:MAG TPA: hypothetical protein VIL42_07480 [Sphingomicrobium sp.]